MVRPAQEQPPLVYISPYPKSAEYTEGATVDGILLHGRLPSHHHLPPNHTTQAGAEDTVASHLRLFSTDLVEPTTPQLPWDVDSNIPICCLVHRNARLVSTDAREVSAHETWRIPKMNFLFAQFAWTQWLIFADDISGDERSFTLALQSSHQSRHWRLTFQVDKGVCESMPEQLSIPLRSEC